MSDFANTDALPAERSQQTVEAPLMPRAMPGDEAEPPQPEQSARGTTLCSRCAMLAQAKDIKTVTDFSRWLRACGFSRSQATKIAGHGWPQAADEEAPSNLAAEIAAHIAGYSTKEQSNGY